MSDEVTPGHLCCCSGTMMEEPLPAPATIKAPATPSKTVAFKMSAGVSEREREKFLTAKYVLYCTVLFCTVQCYQVRGAPDGAHQEAAQGGDVDLRPAAGALRDRGQQTFLATLSISRILHHSKRTKVCRFMLPTYVALQQSLA